MLCPHKGDAGELGERVAGEAAAVLARVGSVAVASVPLDLLDASGKGDVSDVLERGGLARLRSYLAAAVCWDTGSLAVEEAHKRLVELVGGCVERGGVHAVAANLGHGKSYAAVGEGLGALEELTGAAGVVVVGLGGQLGEGAQLTQPEGDDGRVVEGLAAGAEDLV